MPRPETAHPTLPSSSSSSSPSTPPAAAHFPPSLRKVLLSCLVLSCLLHLVFSSLPPHTPCRSSPPRRCPFFFLLLLLPSFLPPPSSSVSSTLLFPFSPRLHHHLRFYEKEKKENRIAHSQPWAPDLPRAEECAAAKSDGSPSSSSSSSNTTATRARRHTSEGKRELRQAGRNPHVPENYYFYEKKSAQSDLLYCSSYLPP
jgi:hypothetical protein